MNKIKFKGGVDANRMLMRKLLKNFLTNSKLKTTLKKAKAAKPQIEKLVEKTKVKSEANLNYLLTRLGDPKLVERLFKDVGPAMAKITGGYVRITKLGRRDSDNAEAVEMKWAYPVVNEVVKKADPTKKAEKVSISTKKNG